MPRSSRRPDKSHDSEESRKLEAFFKFRPKELDLIGSAAIPSPPSGTPSPGSFVIPVMATDSSVIVRVTLKSFFERLLDFRYGRDQHNGVSSHCA
jgi:hypothetical protein